MKIQGIYNYKIRKNNNFSKNPAFKGDFKTEFKKQEGKETKKIPCFNFFQNFLKTQSFCTRDEEENFYKKYNLTPELKNKIVSLAPLERSVVILNAQRYLEADVLKNKTDDEIIDEIYQKVELFDKKTASKALKLIKSDKKPFENYDYLDCVSKISNKNFQNILNLISEDKFRLDFLPEINSCAVKRDSFNEVLENVLKILKMKKVESLSDIRFISYFYSSDYFSNLHNAFDNAVKEANLAALSKVDDIYLANALKGINNKVFSEDEINNIQYYSNLDTENLERARKIVSSYKKFDYDKNGKYLTRSAAILVDDEDIERLVKVLKIEKIQEIDLFELVEAIIKIGFNSSKYFDFDKILKLARHEKINKDNFLIFLKCFLLDEYENNVYDYVEKFLNDDEIAPCDVEMINYLQLDSPNYKKTITLLKNGFLSHNANGLSDLSCEKMNSALLFAQDNVNSEDVKYFIENFDKNFLEKIALLCGYIDSSILIKLLENNDINDVLEILDNEKLDKNAIILEKLNPVKYNKEICALMISRLFNLNHDFDFNFDEFSIEKLSSLSELLNDISTNFKDFESGYMEILEHFSKFIQDNFKNFKKDDKITAFASLKSAIPYKSDKKYEKEIEKIKNLCQKIYDNIFDSSAVYNVAKSNVDCFFKEFIANNNKDNFEILKNADIEKYAKSGMPMEFSRGEFLKSLNSIFAKIEHEKCTKILKKLEITPIYSKKPRKITGFDGIINYSKLDKNDKVENEIYLLCEKFFEKNRVLTDNEDLNRILNSLIKACPEFINIIGKKQHFVHDYSLDIHTLKVLKEAFCDKEFEKLDNCDKTIMKFLILFHDISKQESKISHQHPYFSAIYSISLLSRFNLSPEVKERIFELIKNHNWLEMLDSDEDKRKIAAFFRNYHDFEIAKIFAKADLKGTSEDFYKEKVNIFTSSKFAELSDLISQINNSGQIILPNQIINKKNVPKTIFNGKEYMVIDFSKVNDDVDLSEYGFEKGTNKQNLRLNVHMVSEFKNSALEALNILANPNCEDTLCSSLISLYNQNVYCNFRFGVTFLNQGFNIANSSKYNQTSGRTKKFDEFVNLLFPQSFEYQTYRTFLSSKLKENLKLSDEEYQKIYVQICDLKYLSKINDVKIGSRILRKDEIISALKSAQDELLGINHNEINSYNPKINAFVARVDSIEQIPEGFLNFVEENNLPVLII